MTVSDDPVPLSVHPVVVIPLLVPGGNPVSPMFGLLGCRVRAHPIRLMAPIERFDLLVY
jgi:hypothetical protein